MSRLLDNALSHFDGMAYSPAQAMLLGFGCMLLFGYLTYSGWRKGAVPRAKPYWGQLPPEMGTEITREKNPAAFRRNIWCGAIMTAIGAITFIIGVLEIPGI